MSGMQGEHTVEKPWGKYVYWKDNVACGCLDQWTHVAIHVWPNNHGVSDMRFTQNDRNYHRVDHALQKAFGHGKKARSKEFAKLISDTGYGV